MNDFESYSECIKVDANCYCPQPGCNTELFSVDCEKHSPPKGLPNCLSLCTCPKCGHKCCCDRESPEPSLEPEPEIKRIKNGMF